MGFEYLDCGSGHGGEARCWPCPFGALPTGADNGLMKGQEAGPLAMTIATHLARIDPLDI